MVKLNYDETAGADRVDVIVWYCDECRAFHLGAGPVTLTFEAREFAGFIEHATETHLEQALRGKMRMPETGLQRASLMIEAIVALRQR